METRNQVAKAQILALHSEIPATSLIPISSQALSYATNKPQLFNDHWMTRNRLVMTQWVCFKAVVTIQEIFQLNPNPLGYHFSPLQSNSGMSEGQSKEHRRSRPNPALPCPAGRTPEKDTSVLGDDSWGSQKSSTALRTWVHLADRGSKLRWLAKTWKWLQSAKGLPGKPEAIGAALSTNQSRETNKRSRDYWRLDPVK